MPLTMISKCLVGRSLNPGGTNSESENLKLFFVSSPGSIGARSRLINGISISSAEGQRGFDSVELTANSFKVDLVQEQKYALFSSWTGHRFVHETRWTNLMVYIHEAYDTGEWEDIQYAQGLS